jgi:hypothetical protein
MNIQSCKYPFYRQELELSNLKLIPHVIHAKPTINPGTQNFLQTPLRFPIVIHIPNLNIKKQTYPSIPSSVHPALPCATNIYRAANVEKANLHKPLDPSHLRQQTVGPSPSTIHNKS